MAIVIAQPQQHLFKARLGRVRQWVALRLGDTRHEQRVMQIALGIFNLTAHLHGLDAPHRRMLKLAALLHDVGRTHGAQKHHIHGSRMVRKSRTLNLRPSERLAVAYLARHHRGRLPDARKQWRYPKLENPRTMQWLLAILRAADALDSRNFATPALSIRLKADRLRVRCYVHDVNEAQSALVRPKKFRPLEELLGVNVAVQLRPAETMSA